MIDFLHASIPAPLHGGLLPEFTQMLIYTIGFLVAVFVGTPFVKAVLKQIQPLPTKKGNAKRVGRLIGILERAIIISMIFAEAYGAIGLVLAAKSISRFEKLTERDFSEYYLVGTLASVSFGIIVGLVTLAIARMI